jgi:hypothetical protein
MVKELDLEHEAEEKVYIAKNYITEVRKRVRI